VTRNGLSMITCRSRHDTALFFDIRQAEQFVECAALLEGVRLLTVIKLEKQIQSG
jgi:hypothetical protein